MEKGDASDLAPPQAGSSSSRSRAKIVRSCPYLDTINRSLLDFDFEHSCSVTLESGPHVYGCLVCGKFFRGRGRSTPAYTHSVDEGHAVYVHLSKGTFHCLPDDYEVQDPSLADISAALHPSFDSREITTLDSSTVLARDLFGRRYLPGFVGLNNLNKTDCLNAVVQALAHVRPLRDFFLTSPPSSASTAPSKDERNDDRKRSATALQKPSMLSAGEHSHLVCCFGELVRKMWSDKRFKSTVDPHMFVQSVSTASRKRYRIGKQHEAGEFMVWLLHQLHVGLGGTRKPGSSIIHRIFQGTVQITTRQRRQKLQETEKPHQPPQADDRLGSDAEVDEEQERIEAEHKTKSVREESLDFEDEETSDTTNFLQLTLDIPEKPLFKDEEGGIVIPQEPLVSVLRKFDGISFSDAVNTSAVASGANSSSSSGSSIKRRYRLRRLPPFLILHLARFKRNSFVNEKNPTIVAFPVENLDFNDYVYPRLVDKEDKATKRRRTAPTEEEVRAMSVKELKKLLSKYGQADLAQGVLEREELVEKCVDFVVRSLPDLLSYRYNLVANITHHIPAEVGREGRRDPLEEGSYRCHVQHRSSGQWYEIQDLHVQETMPQLIGLSESYLLIFEKRGFDSSQLP